jgi:PPOX class probable F420-dependent enzyme
MNNRQRALNDIQNKKCISLTTLKRDGTRVSTPIWFNIIDEKVYVTTESSAWKVKRIANNPRVEFATCTQRGKVTGRTSGGTARVITREELTPVLAAKKRRYPLFRLIVLFKKDQVGIEITPDA